MFVVSIEKGRSRLTFYFEAVSEEAARKAITSRLGNGSGWQIVPTER